MGDVAQDSVEVCKVDIITGARTQDIIFFPAHVYCKLAA